MPDDSYQETTTSLECRELPNGGIRATAKYDMLTRLKNGAVVMGAGERVTDGTPQSYTGKDVWKFEDGLQGDVIYNQNNTDTTLRSGTASQAGQRDLINCAPTI